MPLPLLGCLREWLLVFGHVYPDDLRTPFGFLRTVYGVSTRGKYGVLVHEFPEKAQERALRALWSPPTRPARGPQRGLTVEAIVTAAIDLVEAEGLAALSMRQVAARLGVGTATLYTYLPGKAELTALMLDAVTGDGPLPHEWPGDWRAKLTSWARDDWEAYRRHPWILELSSAGVAPGPNQLRWLDSALRSLDGTGLTEAEKVAVIESIDGYVRGLATLHQPPDGTTTDGATATEIERRNRLLRELVDFTQYPALAQAIRKGAVPYVKDQFEFGLQRLLDGVAALIESRRAGG